MDAMRLNMKLNLLLNKKGWSQEQLRLAMKTQPSAGTVSSWCSGRGVYPRLDQAYDMANVLGCDLVYLADDDLDNEPGAVSQDEKERMVMTLAKSIGYQEALDRLSLKGTPVHRIVIRSEEETSKHRGSRP